MPDKEFERWWREAATNCIRSDVEITSDKIAAEAAWKASKEAPKRIPSNKVYIATRLHNAARAQEIKAKLEELGIEITYDWTVHGQVYTDEELREFGLEEENGVRECSVLLMIFPGGNGSHWEAGLARGLGIPIVLLAEKEVEKKTFYYLPNGVYHTKTENEAIKKVLELCSIS